ncbi:MAG: site-2 protease family protein [Saprospiraceae bacterium]|nr:site-2 protease family protein [Lewinella sp.]
MKGSIQIARLFGIPIQLHWSFFLILGWIVYIVLSRKGYWDWHSLGWTALSVFVLFFCVVLHELGHALTARRYGVKTRNIMLLPIGGLAVLERLPEKPKQELWVALAGPMVNVGLAVFFAPLLLLLSHEKFRQIFGFIIQQDGNFFARHILPWEWFIFGLVALNLIVALFNLLPAFPMDGGRILRAFLSLRLARIRATRIATFLGQVFAVILLATAWEYGNWAAGIIGVFVYFNATVEYRSAREEQLLERLSVKDAMRRQFSRLYPKDEMARAFQLLRQDKEHNFLVFDHWQNLQAVLSEETILKTAKNNRLDHKVEQWAGKEYDYVFEDESMKAAMLRMQKSGQSVLPVCNRYGRLTGLIDRMGVDHALRLQRQLKS